MHLNWQEWQETGEWGAWGALRENELVDSLRTQPAAPCPEDLLTYGVSNQTSKTLSPLGEGRSVERSELRVPLGEEGLRWQQEGNDAQQRCAPHQEDHLKNSGQDKAGKTYVSEHRRTNADKERATTNSKYALTDINVNTTSKFFYQYLP